MLIYISVTHVVLDHTEYQGLKCEITRHYNILWLWNIRVIGHYCRNIEYIFNNISCLFPISIMMERPYLYILPEAKPGNDFHTPHLEL